MNPYEEPSAVLYDRPRKFSLGAIVQAAGVYFLAWLLTYAIQLLIILLSSRGSFSVTVFPCIAGAFYLALRVNQRRVFHGLVYSVIPVFWQVMTELAISRYLDQFRGRFYFDMVEFQLVSTVVTLVTMWITYVLLGRFLAR